MSEHPDALVSSDPERAITISTSPRRPISARRQSVKVFQQQLLHRIELPRLTDGNTHPHVVYSVDDIPASKFFWTGCLKCPASNDVNYEGVERREVRS
jgi:hypothetical protein